MQAELPNPVNFDAATALVTADVMAENFGCGPDVERHAETARPFAEAGYDHLALINAGPDVDGFFDHAANGLIERVRALGS
ncbi:hypothetical protein WCD74_21585 [Actinomycetospora sp. OC33-EN08]|uniref:Uncharacterized protein n=1 Tax=Actinomycetospora aurantiaca TaxID=3129233 RepID=A0ABU8MST7_9PSEU